MTKPEAAAFLGVSEKTISRYVSASKLTAHYVAGKTGRQLDFKEDELEQFRRAATETIEAGQPGQDTSGALVPTPAVALPVAPPLTLADLVRAIVAETRQDKPLVPPADKLVLSLDEAAALSGVPRSALDAARKDGRLHTVKIGRGYKVRRGDLETFVASLFEAPG